MSEHLIGIVEDVVDNGVGKGSHIVVNGLKLGAYDPTETGFSEVAVGNTVALNWKPDKTGKYKNVSGKVRVMPEGTPLTSAPVEAESAPATKGGKSGYRKNGEAGGFPIHADAYERALDRRNALTCATQLAVTMELTDADKIIELARKFEAYTTGDERAEAEAMLAFAGNEE